MSSAPFSPSLSEYVQRHRMAEDVRRLVESDLDDLASHYSMVSQDDTKPKPAREASAVYVEADENFQDGYFHKAIELAFEALQGFQAIGDKKGVQDAMLLSQSARSASGLAPQAVSEATEMLEQMKKDGDKRGQGCMLLALLEGKAATGNYADALDFIDEALELFKDDPQMKIITHLRSAKVWSMQGDVRKAAQAAEDGLALAQSSSNFKMLEARAQLALAAARLDVDQCAEALAAAKAAVSIGKEGKSDKLVASALIVEVDCHLLMEKPRLACLAAQEALDLCKKMDYTWGEGVSLDALVYALMECGETNRAKKVTDASLKRFQAKADVRGQACAQSALAHIYAETHDVAAALRAAEEEAALVSLVHGTKRPRAANFLVQSYIHFLRKDGSQAKSSAHDAAAAYEEMDDTKGAGLASYAECFALLLDDKVPEALEAATKARDSFAAYGDRRWEARSMWATAMANVVKKENTTALDEVTEAKKVFEELGDKKMTATALVMIADVQRECDEFEDSILSAEEAIDLFKELGYKRGEAAALTRQALAHMKKPAPEPEVALDLLTEAKKLCKAILDKQGEANVSLMMSTAHLEVVSQADTSMAKSAPGSVQMAKHRKILSRSNRQARTCAKAVNSIAKFTGDKQQLGISFMHTASSRATQGRLPEALKAAEKAEKAFKAIDDEALQAHALVLQAEIQMAEAQPKKPQIEKLVNKALELAQKTGDAQAEDRSSAILQELMGGAKAVAMLAVEAEEAEETTATSVAEKKATLDPEYVKQQVAAAVAAVLVGEEDDVLEDSPLMESGMDSLSSVAFRNQLAGALSMNLPASLMFDYPSQRAIIEFVMETSAA
mmetsp:Transcript_59816/g.142448  ORF Transcript_59816/g.142448 Transcript_59816/m.142448 type:complete len:845 (-) Transcript_59816:87-2621(-)|eukprot:CAMPEP_0178450448 /NCGR_PEP_ID=MMETSP0689_2-20121128/43131_1 /TAXON_ID=160604 /ORGANISM="Amphidinium massartii, Strain CS-259" /LENGTH=844 /DNA_ID=CAMNT_0020075917 /DNA_START=14 /DNA_END=2548 /DNA_ORIENTATION=-